MDRGYQSRNKSVVTSQHIPHRITFHGSLSGGGGDGGVSGSCRLVVKNSLAGLLCNSRWSFVRRAGPCLAWWARQQSQVSCMVLDLATALTPSFLLTLFFSPATAYGRSSSWWGRSCRLRRGVHLRLLRSSEQRDELLKYCPRGVHLLARLTLQ